MFIDGISEDYMWMFRHSRKVRLRELMCVRVCVCARACACVCARVCVCVCYSYVLDRDNSSAKITYPV